MSDFYFFFRCIPHRVRVLGDTLKRSAITPIFTPSAAHICACFCLSVLSPHRLVTRALWRSENTLWLAVKSFRVQYRAILRTICFSSLGKSGTSKRWLYSSAMAVKMRSSSLGYGFAPVGRLGVWHGWIRHNCAHSLHRWLALAVGMVLALSIQWVPLVCKTA